MRQVSMAVGLVLVLAVAVFLSVRAGESRAGVGGAYAALVVENGSVDPNGGAERRAFRVDDPRQLARLEAFFPDYQRRPKSGIAAGWEAGHEIYFDFPNGEAVRVTVSRNENAPFWSTGRGDFRTQGDFETFVAELQAKPAEESDAR